LAVVKSLVERNGGRVGVRSEVGQGARFSFTIPKHLTSVVDESFAAP
jgi:signal transduction histidine kinase